MMPRRTLINELCSHPAQAVQCIARWIGMATLTMLSTLGNAEAACSSYVGTLVFNEVQQPNGGTTYLELRILNPNILAATNRFAGWKLSVNTKISGTTTSVTKNFDEIVSDSSLNTCGPNSAWIQIPDAAINNAITNARGNGDINFVLYDASNNMVDLLRISNANNNTSMQSFYPGAGSQCSSIEPSPVGTLNSRYDFRWGQGSSIKDWYRTPDGTGNWTGTINANNANSICGSNDVGATAQVGLNKVAGTATVNTDTDFSFQLFAQNPSTGVAQSNVVVTDNLNNAGLSFVSCAPTAPDTCTHAGGVVTWTIASLPINAIRSTLLTVKAATTGTKTNTITASTSGTPTASASVLVTNSVPTITTVAASSITSTSGVLNGTVNPRGTSTTVSFGYGTAPSFYTSTCTPASNTFTGSTQQNFSCTLTGLTCGTTYYYRATGTNSAGTSNGSDMSFTPPCPAATASAFNAFESTTPANAITGKIYTKLAGVPFDLDIVAINETTQATTFNDNVKLELLANTGTPGIGYGSDNCPTANQLIQTIPTQTLSGGRAKTTTKFSSNGKVYQDVRVRITYTGTTPNVIACSNDSFAIRPTAPTFSTTASALPPGVTESPTIKAGAAFTLNAATTASDGYGGTLAQDSGKLAAHSGGTAGSLQPETLIANNSVADNASYAEVGYVYLMPGAYADKTFTTVDRSTGDCILDTTADANLADSVDASGKYGCDIGNRTELSLGRFIPDHFTLSPPTITQGCSNFTYMDQPFAIAATIEAQNLSGTKTANYSGAFAKGTVSFSLENANDGNNLIARLSGLSGAWSQGSYLADTSNATFARAGSPDGAFESLVLAVKVTDPDGPMLQSLNENPETGVSDSTCLGTTQSGCTHKNVGTLNQRYGRLRLTNAFGTVAKPPTMNVRTQYWSGNSWITTTDTCTTLNISSFSMKNRSPVSNGVQLDKIDKDPSGKFWLIHFKEVSQGSAEVHANLAMSWLQHPAGTNPWAKATFGVYPAETRKTVHTRELY